MDHNHVNTGSDLCESKLLNKMNDTSRIKVASEEVRRTAADIKSRGGARTCPVACPGCMCLLGYVLNHVLMCHETCPAPCPTLVN